MVCYFCRFMLHVTRESGYGSPTFSSYKNYCLHAYRATVPTKMIVNYVKWRVFDLPKHFEFGIRTMMFLLPHICSWFSVMTRAFRLSFRLAAGKHNLSRGALGSTTTAKITQLLYDHVGTIIFHRYLSPIRREFYVFSVFIIHMCIFSNETNYSCNCVVCMRGKQRASTKSTVLLGSVSK